MLQHPSRKKPVIGSVLHSCSGSPRTLRSVTSPAWQSSSVSRRANLQPTSCTSTRSLGGHHDRPELHHDLLGGPHPAGGVRRDQRRARLVVGGGRRFDRRRGRGVHVPGQGPPPFTDPGHRAGPRRPRRVDGPRELHELRRGPDRVGRHRRSASTSPDAAAGPKCGSPTSGCCPTTSATTCARRPGTTTCARACRTSSPPARAGPRASPRTRCADPSPSRLTA